MTQDPNDVDDLQEDQVEISSEASSEEPEKDSNDAASDGSSESPQATIEKLEEELALAREQVLRAHADMQNVQRRAQQDVEKAHKFGLEKFVNDILPVADNLERAISTIKEQVDDAVAEGVELTLKSLQDALGRHNVDAIDPEGEPFDPQFHQAMTALEQADVEPNTVLNVFQKGYTLHGRLVRPAMVVVSKHPE